MRAAIRATIGAGIRPTSAGAVLSRLGLGNSNDSESGQQRHEPMTDSKSAQLRNLNDSTPDQKIAAFTQVRFAGIAGFQVLARLTKFAL